MSERIPTNTWLITSESGEEIALIKAPTIEAVQEDMTEEYGMTGGYFARRLTTVELDARRIRVNPATTPDEYY